MVPVDREDRQAHPSGAAAAKIGPPAPRTGALFVCHDEKLVRQQQAHPGRAAAAKIGMPAPRTQKPYSIHLSAACIDVAGGPTAMSP